MLARNRIYSSSQYGSFHVFWCAALVRHFRYVISFSGTKFVRYVLRRGVHFFRWYHDQYTQEIGPRARVNRDS